MQSTKQSKIKLKGNALGKPNLFSYTSFRAYLSEYTQWRKGQDPHFSHRYINMKLGCQSAGWFSDVLKGRLNIGGTRLNKLVELLEFTPREKEFFEALVQFECADATEEKNRWFRKLAEFKETKAQLLNPDQFEYFSEWYYSTIRESFFITPFKGNFEALAKKMLPELKVDQAKRAVKLLIDLGLIEKDAEGNYRPTNNTIKKDSRFRSTQIRSYQKSNLNLALQSIESIPTLERDISSVGVALSPEDYQIACEEIKNLRQKLLRMSEVSKNPTRVYQCNIQLFPQTR